MFSLKSFAHLESKFADDIKANNLDVWNRVESYEEFNYLTIEYLRGNLSETPYNGPINLDRQSSILTLINLNQRGIITSDGQCSCIKEDGYQQRSFLEFYIIIESKFIVDHFLTKLNNRGVNVIADVFTRMGKDKELTYITTYFKSRSQSIDKLITHKDILDLEEKNGIEYWTISRYENDSLRTTSGAVGLEIDSFNNFPEINNLIACNIFSEEWDSLECDQVLLDCITEIDSNT